MAQTVAVVNTSREIAELLALVVEQEGFRPVMTFVPDLKAGAVDFAAFVATHAPAAVIWDIALPYEANWAFFREVAASEAARGRAFVLTPTHKRALEALVGPMPAHELVGKPFDLEELAAALRRAVDQAPSPQRDAGAGRSP